MDLDILFKKTTAYNYFSAGKNQLVAWNRLGNKSYNTTPRSKQRFFKKITKLIKKNRLAYNHFNPFFIYNTHEQKKIFFDMRNSQFGAAYDPQFDHFNYEQETLSFIELLLKNTNSGNKRFLDIGSNWGYYSLCVAHHSPDMLIDAFEPITTTFNDLNSVIDQAGLSSQINTHNVALSNKSGEAFMQHDRNSSGLAHISENGIKVVLKTCDSSNLDNTLLIKIDAEGSEGCIIEGASCLIKEQRPFIIFENWYNTANLNETFTPMKLLSELQYHFYAPYLCISENNKTALYQINDFYHIKNPSSCKIYSTLVPVTLGNRFIFPKHTNLIACHESNLNELKHLYNEQPSI